MDSSKKPRLGVITIDVSLLLEPPIDNPNVFPKPFYGYNNDYIKKFREFFYKNFTIHHIGVRSTTRQGEIYNLLVYCSSELFEETDPRLYVQYGFEQLGPSFVLKKYDNSKPLKLQHAIL